MKPRELPHLVTSRPPETESFTPNPRGGGRTRPSFGIDRLTHGAELKAKYQRATQQTESEGKRGINVTFTSFPGVELALKGLENQGSGEQPQLRSLVSRWTEAGIVELATVYVPYGKVQYFISKIEQYLDSLDRALPRNADLLEVISDIKRTAIEELWSDPIDQFPLDRSERVWWEVWLFHRAGQDDEVDRLAKFADEHGFELGRQFLGFGNRSVALLFISADELALTFEHLDDIVELRRPAEIPDGLLEAWPTDQREQAEAFVQRVLAAPPKFPAVCILDSGVQPDHVLLVESLAPEDLFVADSAWGLTPSHGHATKMAGLALYGDLRTALASNERIELKHRIESVKILANIPNKRELYGAITARGVDQPEIENAQRPRVFVLATTAPRPPVGPESETSQPENLGRPTTWSATLDALAFGRAVDNSREKLVYLDRDGAKFPRLFVVSAGNIDPNTFAADVHHLALSDNSAVEDPAQAWNVLTVGAYAHEDKMDGAHPDYSGYVPVAPRGELAPSSRTSVPIDRKLWPFKPEVVAAGGNHARSSDGLTFDAPDTLSLLTTRLHRPGQACFVSSGDTSAAAALVAGLAADIQAQYPSLRHETVRGLVVHSAEWTDAMRRQFEKAKQSNAPKHDLVGLLRRYGMGVPDRERALKSAADSLTLIDEATIRPFRFETGEGAGAEGKSREMNLHRLPWPIEQLESLGETEVQMRVTLSYFIEPNPSDRGWNGRYAYASHGLRFAMKRPEDSLSDFRKRINLRARTSKDDRPVALETESEWLFGLNQQQASGSLHTDIWSGSAAALASKGALIVYPVAGWWKYRRALDRSEKGVNYSIILSIESPEVEVDFWTPVAAQIQSETVIKI